jgi:hypothetical protein
MAHWDFEISDDLPNLDEIILEEEIELISSRLLYEVPRQKSEKGISAKKRNLCKGFLPNDKKTTER